MDWDEFSDDEYAQQNSDMVYTDHFTEETKLNDLPQFDSMVILLYFSFTSLTTVGFGDFHPQSDSERIFIACGLLFGVAIFSYIVGELIEVIQKQLKHNESGEDEELAKFFGLLRSFNKNEYIDNTLKCEIEKYFRYRWDNDKNRVFKHDEDFINQMPELVQDNLSTTYLYAKFLKAYSKKF